MITVLIATFNGANTLPRTLDAFRRLNGGDHAWSAVVVDNASRCHASHPGVVCATTPAPIDQDGEAQQEWRAEPRDRSSTVTRDGKLSPSFSADITAILLEPRKDGAGVGGNVGRPLRRATSPRAVPPPFRVPNASSVTRKRRRNIASTRFDRSRTRRFRFLSIASVRPARDRGCA